MGQDYRIDIKWTGPIRSNSRHFNYDKVLYMYYHKNEVVYIGIAYRQTVRERQKKHEVGRVGGWINRNKPDGCKIKVGEVTNVERLTKQLLGDIESLIIIEEENKRNFCKANKQCTKTRPVSRPGMKIINHGSYLPLRKYYFDDPI